MWGSGVLRRRRHTALAEMVEAAASSGAFDTPWRVTPQLWEFFDNEGDVLRELQQQWRSSLAGAIYVEIEAGEGDLQQDVLRAFTKVHRRHQALRKILEAHANHPSIAAAMRKERALLSSFVSETTASH